jgi:hypothetical protein
LCNLPGKFECVHLLSQIRLQSEYAGTHPFQEGLQQLGLEVVHGPVCAVFPVQKQRCSRSRVDAPKRRLLGMLITRRQHL